MVEVNNLDDLYDLVINQVEGRFYYDFKPAYALEKINKKEKEIVKDISAFANSGGGIIVYGIKKYDQSDKNYFLKAIDPINRLNFSQEWLENVINTNIFPRLENYSIIAINLNSKKHEIIYVVIIGKSCTVHQVSDYRYYKRFNLKSIPMYDFEIRQIMNQTNLKKLLDSKVECSEYDIGCNNISKEQLIENDSYVFGSDIDEYMQIMLSVV